MLSLGLDLGTTNSVAAVKSQVLELRDEQGGALPSVVAFPPNGAALVGGAARKRRPIDPRNTLVSTKRLMGQHWHSYAAQQFRQNYPLDLVSAPDGGVLFKTRAGTVRPQSVGALIVSHLAARARVQPAEAKLVITVPSSFNEAQRRGTLEACAQAGFQQVRVIEEPVATAIAYLERSSLRYAAVYDFGGGTFDFALVDCSSFPFKVLAHGGEAYLGGDDIDLDLSQQVRERVLREHGWDLGSELMTQQRLLFEVQAAKERLSSAAATQLDLAAVDPAAPAQLPPLEITADALQQACAPHVRRTFGICDEVLGAAGLRAQDVQAVFLAGGSTALPGLQGLLGDYFGGRVRQELDPAHVVAVGASLAAARPNLWPLLE